MTGNELQALVIERDKSAVARRRLTVFSVNLMRLKRKPRAFVHRAPTGNS